MHRACGPRALASSACSTTTCRPLLAVAPHSSTCAAHSRATAQPAAASTSATSSTSCSYSPHHHHQPHHLVRPRRWRTLARSAGGDGSQGEVKQLGPISVPGLIPQDMTLEVKVEGEGGGVEYDEATKTLRFPLSVLEGSMEARRSRLVVFTCDKCGGRTARNVNPVAWDKGMVMGQCAQCEAWHVLSANNKNIYEEIRFDKKEQAAMGAGPALALAVAAEAEAAAAAARATEADAGQPASGGPAGDASGSDSGASSMDDGSGSDDCGEECEIPW